MSLSFAPSKHCMMLLTPASCPLFPVMTRKSLDCIILTLLHLIALRRAKIVYNFGLSKYNRVKISAYIAKPSCVVTFNKGSNAFSSHIFVVFWTRTQ